MLLLCDRDECVIVLTENSRFTEELHERLEWADALLGFFVPSEQKLFYCACFPTFPKDADSHGVEALTQSCLC